MRIFFLFIIVLFIGCVSSNKMNDKDELVLSYHIYYRNCIEEVEYETQEDISPTVFGDSMVQAGYNIIIFDNIHSYPLYQNLRVVDYNTCKY